MPPTVKELTGHDTIEDAFISAVIPPLESDVGAFTTQRGTIVNHGIRKWYDARVSKIRYRVGVTESKNGTFIRQALKVCDTYEQADRWLDRELDDYFS